VTEYLVTSFYNVVLLKTRISCVLPIAVWRKSNDGKYYFILFLFGDNFAIIYNNS